MSQLCTLGHACLQARTDVSGAASAQQAKSHAFAPTFGSTLSAHASRPSPSGQFANTAGNAEQAAATGKVSAPQAVRKDYSAPWAAAAAQHAAAAPSLSPPTAAAHGSNPDLADAQGQSSAPSPSTAPAKQRSSLTESLTGRRPGFPPSTSLFGTDSATASPMLPAFAPASQAASAFKWNMTSSQLPLTANGHQSVTSAQSDGQQQQDLVNTPHDVPPVPDLANGPSKQDTDKFQQAASVASDDSGDTSVDLYPFPTERAAADRLEGIVSSTPYAQDTDGLYVFGQRPRRQSDSDLPATAAMPVPPSHENGGPVASPSGPGPHQVQSITHSSVCAVVQAITLEAC